MMLEYKKLMSRNYTEGILHYHSMRECDIPLISFEILAASDYINRTSEVYHPGAVKFMNAQVISRRL
jgi:hypothetical protein